MEQLVAILPFLSDDVWTNGTTLLVSVIAAALTLVGVVVTNRHNRKIFSAQLKHDADQKALDRKLDLRREVYLLAAEELAKVSSYMGGLTQIDPISENLADGLQGLQVASARLHLVAGAKAACHFGDLVAAYNKFFLRSLTWLSPLHDVQIDINVQEELRAQYQNEVSRILAAMKQLNESGKPDPNAFEALQRSFEVHQAALIEHADTVQELMEKRSNLQTEFTRRLISEMRTISDLQLPAMIALRADLELHGDADLFAKGLSAKAEEMQSELNAFLDGIKSDPAH